MKKRPGGYVPQCPIPDEEATLPQPGSAVEPPGEEQEMTLQHLSDHPQEINHKRLTRNLHELLQELRVTQTGVQILTGFLLTLPFSTRFAHLTSTQRYAYLAILSGSVIATGLIVAPVAFHRMLFQRGQRPWIVKNANRAARAGLLFLALTTR